MVKAKTTATSKVAPAKGSSNKEASKYDKLFEKKARNFSIGQALQPKRDVTRFLRWPKYVQIQRKRVVLKKRLKIPPAINLFNHTLNKANAASLLRLLDKHRPESRTEKKARLLEAGEAISNGGTYDKGPKPVCVKYGINHITALVEAKKAKLVVISHDVDPIEIVVWLPALCAKMDVPFCIIKGKSRLGKLVHKKTATAVCLTDVKPECANEFNAMVNLIKSEFNDNYKTLRKTRGGSTLGNKSLAIIRKREDLIARHGQV